MSAQIFTLIQKWITIKLRIKLIIYSHKYKKYPKPTRQTSLFSWIFHFLLLSSAQCAKCLGLALFSCWFVAWVVKAGFNLESRVTKWIWTTKRSTNSSTHSAKNKLKRNNHELLTNSLGPGKEAISKYKSRIFKTLVSEGKIPPSTFKYSVAFLWCFMRHVQKLFQNCFFLYLCIDYSSQKFPEFYGYIYYFPSSPFLQLCNTSGPFIFVVLFCFFLNLK